MADIKDVSAVIASALDEVSVAGTLDVSMDGSHTLGAVGHSNGDEVEITVVVKPIVTKTPATVR